MNMNSQRALEESYEAEFTARVTAVSAASGENRYTWNEAVVDGTTGDYVDLDGGRFGDDTVDYLVEMNDLAVTVPAGGLLVRARLRGGDDVTQVFEFEAGTPSTGGGGGGTTITVREKDLTPTGTASIVQTDQATGLIVPSVTGGLATLANAAATVTQWGVVTTTTQSFAGSKYFVDFLVSCTPAAGLMYFQTGGAGSIAATRGTIQHVVDTSNQRSNFGFDTQYLSANESTTLQLQVDKLAGTNTLYLQAVMGGVFRAPTIRFPGGVTGKSGTFLGMVFTSGVMTDGSGAGGGGISMTYP